MEEDLIPSPDQFHRQPHQRGRGRVGEAAAVRWLQGEGYEILDRNVSTAAGEIDVIAREGDTLCFIEVKARATPDFGAAVAAVTPRKQRRLARAASLYLAAHPGDRPCRFDVLGLDQGEAGWTYTLIRNAFTAGP